MQRNCQPHRAMARAFLGGTIFVIALFTQSLFVPTSAETLQLDQPVIRALVLPVREGTMVEPVSGTVYITRHGRESIHLEAKQTLQHDDLLQLQGDSSARVRSPSGTERVLTKQHGEWFRFVIEGK